MFDMIRVERHTSYATSTGLLQYSEHCPESEHLNVRICNCTTDVSERPEGKPSHVVQDVTLSGESWEFRLASMSFIYRWKDATGKIKFSPHTYFTFGNGGRSIRMEVISADYESDILNPRKAFFGNLYVGPQIDTSQMMNGHAKSRVVDPGRIGPSDVWMHTCNFGKEATGPVFKKEFWLELTNLAEELHSIPTQYLTDIESPVESVYERVKSNARFLQLVDEIQTRLSTIAPMDGFQKTEAFRVGVKLLKKVSNFKSKQVSTSN